MKLKDKIAVITGAGKGIGRATAKLFLENGCKVVLNSRSSSDLESFINENHAFKDNIVTVPGDISDEKIISEIVNKTKASCGRIDILVNNAGFGMFADMVDSKVEDFDKVFNTNVRAVYMLTKAFLPDMIEQKSGTIINIASIAGKNGFATGTIYCASKHAVMGLSRALHLEVRKYNIRVVALCPGSVATEFFKQEHGNPLQSDPSTVLQSADVAQCCLLAASLPENALINELEIRLSNPGKAN